MAAVNTNAPPISPDRHSTMTATLEQQCSDYFAWQDKQHVKESFNYDFDQYIDLKNKKQQNFAQMRQLEQQQQCKKQLEQNPPYSDLSHTLQTGWNSLRVILMK